MNVSFCGYKVKGAKFESCKNISTASIKMQLNDHKNNDLTGFSAMAKSFPLVGDDKDTLIIRTVTEKFIDGTEKIIYLNGKEVKPEDKNLGILLKISKMLTNVENNILIQPKAGADFSQSIINALSTNYTASAINKVIKKSIIPVLIH